MRERINAAMSERAGEVAEACIALQRRNGVRPLLSEVAEAVGLQAPRTMDYLRLAVRMGMLAEYGAPRTSRRYGLPMTDACPMCGHAREESA